VAAQDLSNWEGMVHMESPSARSRLPDTGPKPQLSGAHLEMLERRPPRPRGLVQQSDEY
jgi:hypothetical protein